VAFDAMWIAYREQKVGDGAFWPAPFADERDTKRLYGLTEG
jgi:hypothetical protein